MLDRKSQSLSQRFLFRIDPTQIIFPNYIYLSFISTCHFFHLTLVLSLVPDWPTYVMTSRQDYRWSKHYWISEQLLKDNIEPLTDAQLIVVRPDKQFSVSQLAKPSDNY